MRAGLAGLVIFLMVLGGLAGFYVGVTCAGTRTIVSATTFTESVPVTVFETRLLTSVMATTIRETETVTETRTLTVTVTSFSAGVAEGGEVIGLCFSALMDCSSTIKYWIGRANKSIHVMVYSFTLDEIAEALIAAKEGGVDVKVVIERENAYGRGSEYQRLLSAGIDVRLDSNPYLMHHKVMIVDGRIVVTGSYNWSWSAEDRNDENLVVIMDEDIAREFEEEFMRVWSAAA